MGHDPLHRAGGRARASEVTDALALEVIRRCVVSVVPQIVATDVTSGRTLAELGCNSIDRADVVVMAMAELGITVPVSEFSRDLDVGDLAALLRKFA
jgi:polyketide biosynthesis acyl carrier protein